jgi:hypothetical protein
MKNLFSIFILLVLISFTACKNKETDPNVTFPPFYEGLFIVNEGGFSVSNSSGITYKATESSNYVKDAFMEKIQRNIGLFPNTFNNVMGTAYITVQGNYGSNNGKIEVINDIDEFSGSRTLNIAGMPYFFQELGTRNLAYVTDNYVGKIWKINTSSKSLESNAINVNGRTAEMELSNNKIFVANPGDRKLLAFDINTDGLLGSVDLTGGCDFLAKDKNGKIWVLASGKFSYNPEIIDGNTKLYCINPDNMSIEKQFDFGSNPFVQDLVCNKAGDRLYFLKNNEVYRMNIDDNTLPSSPYIARLSGNSSFYKLSINPITDALYVSDAKDYNSDGAIYVYSIPNDQINGVLAGNVVCGISPGYVYFKK